MTNNAGGQAPGWYYAEGDPPGSQRYWDGAQWQGDPQMVASEQATSGARVVAEPGERFIAYLIDVAIVIVLYIAVFILAAILGAVSETLGGIVLLLGFLSYIGYFIYNFIYLLGTTGQSIGKKKQGITVLDSTTGQPIGMGGAFIRMILQGIFAMPCYLDHWWILVDDDNLRLSDKVLTNHVYKT